MEWIPAIWNEANNNFHSIADIAKYNADGSLFGVWGAMSDTNLKFERWGEYGMYLAGCEVESDATAPDGFTKWIIPGRKYIVVSFTDEKYGQVFAEMVNDYIPKNGYQIIGAIHERYPKPGSNEIELYFPVG
jgi:predicted transcriptional regulator YdeE